MDNCLNCKSELMEHYKSCPICGQSTTNLYQSFSKITSQALHEMLDIDGRLANTFKKLLLRPGDLSREFMEGRRVGYTPPLRLYLVISLVFFVIVSMVQSTANQQGYVLVAFLLFPAGLLEQIPKLMFVMLPVYAFILQCFHRKSRYIFNVIFALHVHSFMYIMLTIVFVMMKFEYLHVAIFWLKYLFIGFLIYYPIGAFKVMYRHSWPYTIFACLVSFAFYMASIGFGLEMIERLRVH